MLVKHQLYTHTGTKQGTLGAVIASVWLFLNVRKIAPLPTSILKLYNMYALKNIKKKKKNTEWLEKEGHVSRMTEIGILNFGNGKQEHKWKSCFEYRMWSGRGRGTNGREGEIPGWKMCTCRLNHHFHVTRHMDKDPWVMWVHPFQILENQNPLCC